MSMDYIEKIEDAAFGPQHGKRASKGKADHTVRILLGVVATGIGTITAILLVPDNPQPSGTLFWPAVWCSLGLLTAPLLGMRKNTQAILRTENALMVGLIYWLLLDLLQGAYPLTVSYDDVIFAFTGIGTMAAGIWIGMLGTGWSPPKLVLRAAKLQFSTAWLFRVIWISFFLGMGWFAYSSNFDPLLMIEALGWCRFCAPWSTGAFGGADAFLVHLQYFGYVLPSLTVVLAQRVGWVRPKTIIGIILSIIIALFLAQGGGRRIIGVVLGAAVLTWFLLQKRIRLKSIVGGLIGITIILVSMEQMLEYRQFGFSSSSSSIQEEDTSVVHVDDNFLRLCQIEQLIPNIQPYVGLQPLYYALTLPIPRVLWPGKPSDPGYDLTNLLGWKGVSLTTSIVGELYSMNGLIVVFIGGLVFGLMANMWNRVLAAEGGEGKYVLFCLGLMVLVAGLRSMQDLVIMSYALFAWLGIASLFPRARASVVARAG